MIYIEKKKRNIKRKYIRIKKIKVQFYYAGGNFMNMNMGQ